MGRHFKTGVDYFPLDVNIDDKVKLIQAKHGVTGFAVWVKLLQKIYADNFWIEWGDDNAILLSDEINVDINTINVIINDLLDRNVFCKCLFDEYKILTSHGIQKRYFEITSRRKKIEIVKEYMLVDINPQKEQEFIYVNINQKNAYKSTQSKVKESKVKKYPEDSTEFRVALFMLKHIRKNKPDYKEPNLQAWAKDADLLLRKDKRDLGEVKKLIAWAQSDEFEMANVLSISKLRKRYDNLTMKMNRELKKTKDEDNRNLTAMPGAINV